MILERICLITLWVVTAAKILLSREECFSLCPNVCGSSPKPMLEFVSHRLPLCLHTAPVYKEIDPETCFCAHTFLKPGEKKGCTGGACRKSGPDVILREHCSSVQLKRAWCALSPNNPESCRRDCPRERPLDAQVFMVVLPSAPPLTLGALMLTDPNVCGFRKREEKGRTKRSSQPEQPLFHFEPRKSVQKRSICTFLHHFGHNMCKWPGFAHISPSIPLHPVIAPPPVSEK